MRKQAYNVTFLYRRSVNGYVQVHERILCSHHDAGRIPARNGLYPVRISPSACVHRQNFGINQGSRGRSHSNDRENTEKTGQGEYIVKTNKMQIRTTPM